eukprot:5172502-Pleurochrysis_carterae.AAC.3
MVLPLTASALPVAAYRAGAVSAATLPIHRTDAAIAVGQQSRSRGVEDVGVGRRRCDSAQRVRRARGGLA